MLVLTRIRKFIILNVFYILMYFIGDIFLFKIDDLFRYITCVQLYIIYLITVAPDRPKIYFQDGNVIGRERQENYQQVSGNMIVVDEGSETITLICRVVGGK